MKKIWLRLAMIVTAVILTISVMAFWLLPFMVAKTAVLSRFLSAELGAPVMVQQPDLFWQDGRFQLNAKKITVLPKLGSLHPAASWSHFRLSIGYRHAPELTWQKAKIVVGLDKNNHIMLGNPAYPVQLKKSSKEGVWFCPSLLLNGKDTEILLIKNKKQQASLQLHLRKTPKELHIQWGLGVKPKWQQLSVILDGKQSQINMAINQWDIAPLLHVLGQEKTTFLASRLNWSLHWKKTNGLWQGGWKDMSLHTRWQDETQHTLAFDHGEASWQGESSRRHLNMYWPSLHFDDVTVKQVSSQWQSASSGQWQWVAKDINLAKWVPALQSFLSPQQTQQLQILSPKGKLSSLQADFNFNVRPSAQITVALNHLQWQGNHVLPSVTGLSGKVIYDIKQQTAHALLSMQDGHFDWPEQFPLSWNHIKFSTDSRLQGTENGWNISLEKFNFQDKWLQANASGSMIFPAGNDAALFDWKMKFSLPNVLHTKNYLPKSMAPDTRRWLRRALQGGAIKDAEMIWKGPSDKAPFAHHEGVWELKVPVHDLLLNYSNKWPYLRHTYGVAKMDNTALRFYVTKAGLLGNQVSNGKGDILDVHHPVLHIQASFNTQLAAIKKFIEATPMAWKNDLKPLRLSGRAKVDMQLTDDMVQDKQTVLGTLKLKNDIIKLPEWNLNLSQVKGVIGFTEKGLHSQKIKAQLFHSPANIELETKQQSDHSTLLKIDATGQVLLKKWRKKGAHPLLGYLQGKTDYQAHLIYDGVAESKNNSLTVLSSLQGVRVELPYPFHKDKQSILPVQLSADLTPGKPAELMVRYGKKAQARFQLHQVKGRTQLKKGVIHIGPKISVWPKESGLTLIGLIDRLDGKQWAPVLSALTSDKSQKNSVNWSAAHLEVTDFSWGEMSFSTAYLSAHPGKTGWLFDLKSDYGLANLRIPNEVAKGMALRFQKFNWKPLFQKSKTKMNAHSLQENWSSIPRINIACSECRYGKKYLGSVDGVYQELRKGKHQLQISWDYEGTVLDSTTVWGNGKKVEWKGSADIANLDMIESHLTDTQYIKSGRGIIDFDLHWRGGPFDLTTKSLEGGMQADLKHVKFIHIPKNIQSSLNYVKLMDALNFENALPIVSTVRSGFYAPHIRFSGHWKHKVFKTTDFELESPVLNMDAQGKVDLAHKTLDMRAGIQPQVTGSLPAIATIAGGPVMGIFAYAVNKIIQPLVGKAVEHHYQIKGPFANLSVKKLD